MLVYFGDQTRNHCQNQPQAVADVELCLACVEGRFFWSTGAVDHGISMALSGFIAFYNLLYIYIYVYIFIIPSKPHIKYYIYVY